MAKNSKIEWCTDSFNTHWGCTEVASSPACDKCYARGFSKRLGLDLWGATKPRRFFGDAHWAEPLAWHKIAVQTGVRRRIFVNSMSDTFEGRRDLDPVRGRLWDLISVTPLSDYLLLTKRPQNILRMVPSPWLSAWPANVWIGTTAEDMHWARIRLPFLREVPAQVRFVSIEPVMEPMVLSEFLGYISWAICGGESGPGARPCRIEWLEGIVNQCRKASVPCFVKQMGSNSETSYYHNFKEEWNGMGLDWPEPLDWVIRDGQPPTHSMVRIPFKDRKGADPAEWPENLRIRTFPRAGVL